MKKTDLRTVRVLDGPRKGEILVLRMAKKLTTGIFIRSASYHKNVPDGTIYAQDADEGMIAKLDGSPYPIKILPDPE